MVSGDCFLYMATKYNIPAKTTVYKGRIYRSRLEAKWQAMFDLLGWAAEYEPSQINGYNPDFIIPCSSDAYDCNAIIVEVKPLIFITDEYKKQTYNKYNNINCHLIIVSDTPFGESRWNRGWVSLGIGYQCDAKEELYDLTMKGAYPTYDIGSDYMSFDGMIKGEVYRKDFILFNSLEHTRLLEIWNRAHNLVMFEV